MGTANSRGQTSWHLSADILVEELRRGDFAPSDAPSLPGFDDLQEIGRGGQAVVYVGIQRSTKRRVAVKVLLEGGFASASGRHRFERETELVASLRHPHIVRVFDSGISKDGRPFCVMEYIEGVSLHEHLQSLRASPSFGETLPGVLRLFIQIGEAVFYAHQRGVIHRDLKPSNVRIDAEGKPHVLDFGLAKVVGDRLDPPGKSALASMTGQFLGTLAFASPEQAGGTPDEVDTRTDVYGLGVMLYQAVTGQFPYEVSGGLHSVLDHIIRTEPVPPSRIARHVNDELQTIVLKCLHKDPERRYQTAGEFTGDLRRYLAGEAISAKGDSTWYTLRKTLRRYKLTAMALTLVMAVISVALVISLSFWRQAVLDRDRTETAQLETKAVNDFLEGMLRSIDPEFARGREVTVREVVDQAAPDIENRFAGQPLVQARIHATVGYTYMQLGEFEKAESHLRAAHEIHLREVGPESERTLWTANELGRLLSEMNKLDEAEELLTDALAAAERIPRIGAEPALWLKSNLAYLYDWQGRQDESEALYRETLKAAKQRYGENHRDAIITMNNLAALLGAMGRYEEAQELYEHAYRGRLEALGPDHPQTLNTRANMALMLDRMGKPIEAVEQLQEVLVDLKRVLGEEHPIYLNHVNNLGTALATLGRLDEAEQLYRQNLEKLTRVLGPDHDTTLQAVNNYGTLLIDRKKLDEAEAFLRKVGTQFEAAFGEDDSRVLMAKHNLAAVLEDKGQLDEAERLLRKIIAARKRTLGARHPNTLTTINNLARMLVDLGESPEAEALYRESVAGFEESLPEGHWVTAVARGGLGKCLMTMERYAEAETELLASYETEVDALGPDNAYPRKVAQYLADLYDAWNKPDRAEEWRRKSQLPEQKK